MKKILCITLICVLCLTSFSLPITQKIYAKNKPNRIEKLFKKNTLPKTTPQMNKYLSFVKLPVLKVCLKKTNIHTKFNKKTIYFKKKYIKRAVHKKLKKKYLNAFKAMVKARFPVYNADIFMWKMKTINSSQRSNHSYGVAIDINNLDNPLGGANNFSIYCINAYTKYIKVKINNKYIRMPKNKIVDIWEKYGFTWGGHWKEKDNMHFEYKK